MFKKYQHVERWNTEECDGLFDGECYVFYKLDGTNASLWWDYVGEKVCCGSRNRNLTLQGMDGGWKESDNAGFRNWVYTESQIPFVFFFQKYPHLRLYGEWLVPHSLKSYRDDAWKRFYVFDVYDDQKEELLHYEAYRPLLVEFGIDYVPPLAIVKNMTEEHILKCLEQTGQFLVKDGLGRGEGIVIKNYNYVNKYGRQVWGKVVTNEFKILNHAAMGVPLIGSDIVEERIVEEFCTEEFIKKERSKIIWARASEEDKEKYMYSTYDNGEPLVLPFKNEYIPELLGRVWYEFVKEETYNWVKKYKNPKVNFRVLQQFVIQKTKKVIGL